MSLFDIGDKVKVINRDTDCYGEIGTIIDIDKDWAYPYEVSFDGKKFEKELFDDWELVKVYDVKEDTKDTIDIIDIINKNTGMTIDVDSVELTLKIPTLADMMRRMAIQAIKDKKSRKIDEVLKMIEDKAQYGGFELYLQNSNLNKDDVEHLRNLGFEVEESSTMQIFRDEKIRKIIHKISWREKDGE